jgi:sortase A
MFQSQTIQQENSVLEPQVTSSSLLADPARELQAEYGQYPEKGDRVGTITLESLGISWPIFEGTQEAQLSKGVGHYIGSVLPGVLDNTILSGHQSTVFARLGDLEKGDRVIIKTDAGIFVYSVTGFQVVDRSDQTVIQPTDEPTLTLTTCYPFGAIGNTTEAYIVTAELVSSSFKPQ